MTLPEPARTAWAEHRNTILAVAASRHPPSPTVLHGGTILAARWHHRDSEDLDIFMPERRNLTDVWPGKPRDIERATGGKLTRKSTNQVIVALKAGGVLDISAAEWKLPGAAEAALIDGRHELVLDSSQILHGKLQRASDPPVRDAFDFITAAKLEPRALERAINALTADENRFVRARLTLKNDELARNARDKLTNVRTDLQIPYSTIGIDAARTLGAHLYSRVRIDRTSDGIKVETFSGRGPAPATTYCNQPGRKALEAEKLDTHLERCHGIDLEEVYEALDTAGRKEWTGTVIDTADERPWERTKAVKMQLRSTKRGTGLTTPR